MYHQRIHFTHKKGAKINRLTMFGHLTRKGIVEPLGKTRLFEAPGLHPPARPKKTLVKTVEEDLGDSGAVEEYALDRWLLR